jgi:ribosomal protein L39E
MARNKTYSKKVKMVKASKVSKSAPRWCDLKVFGLLRARFKRIVKKTRRNWRRNSIDY